MTTAHNNSQRPALSVNTLRAWLALMGLIMSLSACSFLSTQDSAPTSPHIDINSIPNATPKAEPLSQQGNPDSYVVDGKRYFVKHSSENYHARGIASWYGTKFHGRRTANGEIYDMYKMTAAHKTLPLPSYVRVTNLDNGKQVVVRVNDRGPFHGNRLIDLSYVAARKLGMTGHGTARVEIVALNAAEPVKTAVKNEKTEENSVTVIPAKHIAPIPEATPIAAATAVPATNTLFYLQLGAFSDRQNAENLQAKLLQDTSQPVHISQSDKPKGPIYRVRLGPYPNRVAIENIESKLIALGYAGAQIVADEH